MTMRHARQARHLLRLQPSRGFSKRSNFDAGWHPATVAIHGDAWDVPLSSHDGDVAPPLGVSTTFERSDHVYGRDTAPTRQKCEAVLGALEGGTAVLFASGLAATHAAVAAVAGRSPGRTRVAIDGGYHGTHATLKCLAALGADVDVVPLPPPEACGATLGAGDLVWLETPKNPDCALADVAAYAQHAPCAVAVDATFAPPPAQTLLKSGADVVVHSATKYLCGHSDALAGVAATADEGLDAARFAASPAIIVSHRVSPPGAPGPPQRRGDAAGEPRDLAPAALAAHAPSARRRPVRHGPRPRDVPGDARRPRRPIRALPGPRAVRGARGAPDGPRRRRFCD